MAKTVAQIIKMEDMIGRRVLSKSKEVVGEVKDVVLDQLTGNCAYIAISCGGVLGIGAKLYAFLWQDVQYDLEESAYIINLSKKQLEARDSFPSIEWPDKVESLSKPKANEKLKKPVLSNSESKGNDAVKSTKTLSKGKQAKAVKASTTQIKETKSKPKSTKVKADTAKSKVVASKITETKTKPKRATKS